MARITQKGTTHKPRYTQDQLVAVLGAQEAERIFTKLRLARVATPPANEDLGAVVAFLQGLRAPAGYDHARVGHAALAYWASHDRERGDMIAWCSSTVKARQQVRIGQVQGNGQEPPPS